MHRPRRRAAQGVLANIRGDGHVMRLMPPICGLKRCNEVTFGVVETSAVPLPGSLWMLGAALAGVLARGRRRLCAARPAQGAMAGSAQRAKHAACRCAFTCGK